MIYEKTESFVFQKMAFWSVSLKNFIKHKPPFSVEWTQAICRLFQIMGLVTTDGRVRLGGHNFESGKYSLKWIVHVSPVHKYISVCYNEYVGISHLTSYLMKYLTSCLLSWLST